MVIRYPLVIDEDGQIVELPSGDSLPASSSANYASQISYDPSISGYPNNVQGAIDQIYLTQIKYHNDLNGLQLADTGVTYGHITDAAQTLYGTKTFAARTAIGNTTADHKLTIAGTAGVESSLLLKDTTNSKQAILRPVSDGAQLAVGGSNAISIGRYTDAVALSGYSEIARYTSSGLYGVNKSTPIGMMHLGHTSSPVSGQSTSTATTDNGLVIENTTAGLTQLRSEVTSGGQP